MNALPIPDDWPADDLYHRYTHAAIAPSICAASAIRRGKSLICSASRRKRSADGSPRRALPVSIASPAVPGARANRRNSMPPGKPG